MRRPTGFKEFTRKNPDKTSIKERIKGYAEFVSRFSSEDLNQQAARCMDCGIPFCHKGCPLGNVIPEFNSAVYEENWEDAYNILTSTNNFPEFTGRICPAPCEASCVLGINNQPVTIEEIEKHIIEIAFEKGIAKAIRPPKRTGKKVAIVGSGPAGMAAGAQLNYAGHEVIIFEKDKYPGGLLRFGIPDFKLEKWVVERRIRLMEEEGIKFQCATNIGVDINPGDILREFDAVILSSGCNVPRNLPIAGRELNGIHFAMEFLSQNNRRLNGDSIPIEKEILATDKHVIVIGGGDTGSDCVGTSNRHGAKSVTQFELLPKPPKERNKYMPWPNWPMILRTSTSYEEGVQREWGIMTKSFTDDGKGNVKAVKITKLEWAHDEKGFPKDFAEILGSEYELPCDLALLAMGFLHPEHEGLLDKLGVKYNERGNVKTSSYQTSIEKVFAAGDLRRGQSLVVWAISEGRECAKAVDKYLTGNSTLESKDDSLVNITGMR